MTSYALLQGTIPYFPDFGFHWSTDENSLHPLWGASCIACQIKNMRKLMEMKSFNLQNIQQTFQMSLRIMFLLLYYLLEIKFIKIANPSIPRSGSYGRRLVRRGAGERNISWSGNIPAYGS